MKNIYILPILFLLSCGSTSTIKSKVTTLKVIDISEYGNVYGIKTINENTNKENYIVSYKESYYTENGLSLPVLKNTLEIVKGQSYTFQLTPLKPRVGQSQNIGAYIIVHNDTLLSAENYTKLPLAFVSQNSIDLLVQE